ncbi:DNA polymerase I [Acrasis kona]|uniref:DNA-directed DNA polymerase n=1 Tax=Acrasis kona TaxID=1008807 RepID=A0AAW2ZNZ0_9EUKA
MNIWRMHENNLCGISFSTEKGRSAYVPILHTPNDILFPDAQSIISNNDFFEALKYEVFEDSNILKIGHNVKEHIKNLRPFGCNIENYDDVMVMSYSLFCGRHKHDLSSLIEHVLKEPDAKEILIPDKEVVGMGKKKTTFANASIVPIVQSSCQLSDYTMRCYKKLNEEMNQHPSRRSFYQDIEKPLVNTLAQIEITGVCVDQDALKQMESENDLKIQELTKKILQITGMVAIQEDDDNDSPQPTDNILNINSNRQLGVVIFDVLKLGRDLKKKSEKSKDYVLNLEVLQKIADSEGGEIAKLILEYRAIKKLQSTYVQGLQRNINPYTNRIHTTFQNALTVTGRLSSVNPNIQNIPIRTDAGKQIRKCFMSSPNHTILKVDYSQVELRILAHIANIQVLRSAFMSNADVHSITAAQVFHIPLEQVTKDMRQKAKAINFGIIYGMSEYGLSKRINVTVQEARDFIKLYFKQYPGIKKYMESTWQFCRLHNYVNTAFGRTCWIPDINSKDQTRRGFAERTCINTPIQGTSADVTKISMNQLYKELQRLNLKTKMIIQVHDEIVFEAPDDELEKVIPVIKQVMQDAAYFKGTKFSVPLTVDVTESKRWTEE